MRIGRMTGSRHREPVEGDHDGCLVAEGAIDDTSNGFSEIRRSKYPSIQVALAAAGLSNR